jgi:hypothetical protein
MAMAIELTDGVVALRPMTPADAELHLAGEDELAVRFLSGGRSTVETVLAWIERSRVSRDSAGPVRCLGVCLAVTGVLIGHGRRSRSTLSLIARNTSGARPPTNTTGDQASASRTSLVACRSSIRTSSPDAGQHGIYADCSSGENNVHIDREARLCWPLTRSRRASTRSVGSTPHPRGRAAIRPVPWL